MEALVFASDRPLSFEELSELLTHALGSKLPDEALQNSLDTLIEKYAQDAHAFYLTHVGGGYQFLTKSDFHKTVIQLHGDKHLRRLSQAAMETLAIVAYKQPITKSEIEFIRGVNCDYSIQKLLEKDLIYITGRNEMAIGKPLMYATSRSFMDYLGINDPADLPQLKDIAALDIVLPTHTAAAQPPSE